MNHDEINKLMRLLDERVQRNGDPLIVLAADLIRELRTERGNHETRIADLEESLDNSQSLLAMIHHLGSDSPSGITPLDWNNESLTKLTANQIVENRAALKTKDWP